MLSVLSNRTYRRLFQAQLIALLGTGLATVALSLLAFELAGEQAGTVLGTALAIKMAVYVIVAPIATALANNAPTRPLLVILDLIRAATVMALPFVTEIWQVYLLIFLLQGASASFTPLFQATIPEVLTDEQDYTKALSLSRLAYDLENLISPALAAALLTLTSWQGLFSGTMLGFVASALLVLSVVLPPKKGTTEKSIYRRTTLGTRLYLATPRLRGLLALNMVAACAGAMVIVNSVVLVQAQLELSAQHTAIMLASFGAGSMTAALLLPSLLKQVVDRTIMLAGASLLVPGLFASAWLNQFAALLPVWALLGLGYGLILTPSGRLLTRSAHAEDRPALFAAQFSLSHLGWLLAYPLAGWLGAEAGLAATFLLFSALTLMALISAVRLWPAQDPAELVHCHDNLPRHHPHLAGNKPCHSHHYVIDDLHPHWVDAAGTASK